MPLLDQDPIDPEIADALDAIDATLAGEPVDGRYADLAEIALLLASDRPQIPPAFAQSMDDKVSRRFAPAAGQKRRFGTGAPRRRRSWSGAWQAMGAVGVAAALLVAIVVVVGGEQGGSSGASSSSAVLSATPPSTTTSAASSAGSASSGAAVPATGPARKAAASPPSTYTTPSNSSTSGSATSGSATSGSAASGSVTSGSAASGAPAPPLQPPTTGRKVVQGAQLNLAAAPSRIDDVAQEVYDVIGQVNGIVQNSSVTQGGLAGNANFQLSVPSAALGQTLTRLSTLNYAQVVSRTDSSQDITGQYGAATRSLADARALRTSLLKQLANAVTTDQIDSLEAQINDAEASISSDQATLNRLNHQVNYSQLSVFVNAQSVPPPVAHHGGGGFTLRKAAHDAGRVLMVVAGVALIAIAALAPIALVVALAWWVGAALRRRRREQALDSV